MTTSIHLAAGFIVVKLSATIPNPGPKLLSVVAIAEKAENSSTPVAINSIKLIINTKAYAEKKPQTASIIRSGNARCPSLIV